MPKQTKHFGLDVKMALLDQIGKMKSEGLTFPQICSALNSSKQLNSRGKKWTPNNLQMFFYANEARVGEVLESALAVSGDRADLKQRIVNLKGKPTKTATGAVSKALLSAILNESSLSDAQKVQTIRTFVDN